MRLVRRPMAGQLLGRGVWVMPYLIQGQRVLAAVSASHELLAEWPVVSAAEEARASRELWALIDASETPPALCRTAPPVRRPSPALRLLRPTG